MRSVVALVLAVHGAIHLMGFAKAFGYAELPQLTRPISRGMGVLWLTAALLIAASSVMLIGWPRRFWIVGLAGLLISQVAIVSAWRDAWAGTIANVMLLLILILGAQKIR